jgi:hypothetical protein
MKTRSKLGCLLAIAAVCLAAPAQAAAKDVTVRKPAANKYPLVAFDPGKSQQLVRWSVLRRYGGGSQPLVRWVVVRRFGS